MSRWLLVFAEVVLSGGFFASVGIGLGFTIVRRYEVAIVALLWALIFQGFLLVPTGGRR